MRCDSGYEIRTRRSFLVREGHNSYSFRKRRSQLLLCKTTIFVLRMRLKCINANSDFTCLTSQFNILDCPLADDSILSNVAVSVSEEVLWKPVARVVFRYSTQTQAEKFFRKAISYGLNMNQDLAMAKLSLAGIMMQKRRKREATNLLNEAKKLDKHGILVQQIKMMQTQMKRI